MSSKLIEERERGRKEKIATAFSAWRPLGWKASERKPMPMSMIYDDRNDHCSLNPMYINTVSKWFELTNFFEDQRIEDGVSWSVWNIFTPSFLKEDT